MDTERSDESQLISRRARAIGRHLRLPSLRASLLLSIGTAITFVFWLYWDPAFADVLTALKDKDNYWWWFSSDGWSADCFLGIRLVTFVLLTLCAIGATLLIVAGLCIGKRQDRSLQSLFLVVAAAGIWVLLLVRYDDLNWLAVQGRIHRMLPKLKEDVAVLLANPSTLSGTLPFSGAYEDCKDSRSANPKRCLYIIALEELERFGATRDHSLHPIDCITEGKDGSVRFALRYHDGTHGALSVQHRPDDNLPHAEVGQPTEHLIQLEPHWFLTYWILE